MKLNKWTLALAAAGIVSLGSVTQAEEAQHQVMTALSQTTLSGYVDTSANWMIGTSGPLGVPGRAFDGAAKADGFNLNVINLTLEKALDEGAWSAGYKAELLLGPDSVAYNLSPGNTDGELALGDAYVALRAPIGNGLDFRIGSFGTVVGYEVFNAPSNPNYSRSYGWQLEPTQHTGVLASYQLTENVGVSFGVANTLGAGLNTQAANGVGGETQKTYMSSVVFSAPESFGFLAGSTIYAGVVDGISGTGAAMETTNYYAGATIPTSVEGLSVGVAYDYVNDLGGVSNRAYSLAGYVSYQATEKLRVNTRVDFTNADSGIWTPGVPNTANDELISVTGTFDYALWANVLSRAEVRWDHSTTGENPFNRGDSNAVSIIGNIVYKF